MPPLLLTVRPLLRVLLTPRAWTRKESGAVAARGVFSTMRLRKRPESTPSNRGGSMLRTRWMRRMHELGSKSLLREK
eukprot:12589239-Alexandrium_andersonii.AAC.1